MKTDTRERREKLWKPQFNIVKPNYKLWLHPQSPLLFISFNFSTPFFPRKHNTTISLAIVAIKRWLPWPATTVHLAITNHYSSTITANWPPIVSCHMAPSVLSSLDCHHYWEFNATKRYNFILFYFFLFITKQLKTN